MNSQLIQIVRSADTEKFTRCGSPLAHSLSSIILVLAKWACIHLLDVVVFHESHVKKVSLLTLLLYCN